MFISEVEINKKEVYLDGELYDKREIIPIIEFKRMTSSNNLKIINTIPYNWDKTQLCILEIVKSN